MIHVEISEPSKSHSHIVVAMESWVECSMCGACTVRNFQGHSIKASIWVDVLSMNQERANLTAMMERHARQHARGWKFNPDRCPACVKKSR